MVRETFQHGPPQALQDFLESTLPFSELDGETIAGLAAQCSIDFAPKGQNVMVRGATVLDHLLIIQRGGVKVFVRDAAGEVLLDLKGEGDSVGELSLLKDGPADMDAETVEDTFFVKMRKSAFLKIMEDRPCIAHFYLKRFSANYLDKAFSEMGRRKAEVITESGLYLFSSRVGDMALREPLTAPMGDSIRRAAGIMSKERVGSLLITDPSGAAVGIVTDTDLRQAVAVGLDLEAPVQSIMSGPVESIDADEVCFDALMRMMTRNIHHLAVTRREAPWGVVTSHDIMVLQGKSPLSILREIDTRKTIPGLYPLSGKIPSVVRTLVEEGAKAEHITRMVTVLNDLILQQLLRLLTRELGPSPLPFCWLLLGSEGRREQTFATDQDNALLIKDSDDEILRRAANLYLEAFTQQANGHLDKCGFPLCAGGVMAARAPWRRSLSGWTNQVENWIAEPEPEQVLKSAIFFDFRPGFGEESLSIELSNRVTAMAARNRVFTRILAADCLRTKPPLTFFKNFIVETDGEHKKRLDIKKRGLVPFVDFARAMALDSGLKETNTLARLRRLSEEQAVPRELALEAAEAFEFILHLRLTHQLGLAEQGLPPDNYIDPGALSALERRTLKEAFGLIGRMQAFLRERFRLNI
ncbi:MAG: hypothetical protein PWQ57_3430 [Desulfovibrionales bacterium]|nr:hypothetical protein [Desulfovibrionales bacterium]